MMNYERLRETLRYYMDKKQAVHITFWNDGPNRWVNGVILTISDDRLVLLEDKFGEMLIFYDRILDVVPRGKKHDY